VRFVREVQNIRFQGSQARLMLSLEELPRFKAFANGYPLSERAVLGAHLVICPDLDYQERASDAAKYGRLPDQPILDVLIPSLLDPALAPAGRHLLTVDITHVPYQPQDGSWEDFRPVLADLVIEMLETYAPGLRPLISGCELLTPQDYEREYGLAGGDPYHGQIGLDQLLFMRPVPGYARYRTPVTGLYLCGSGAHPGGGLTGAPGYNAARQILSDRG
jgi:phytoene dehydrogenase-like protein